MTNWIERKKLEKEKSFLNLIKKRKNQNDNLYTIPKHLNKAAFSYKSAKKFTDKLYKIMNNRLDKSFGEKMQQLYEQGQEEYYIGIHRTGADPEKLMKEGICYSTNGYYGFTNNKEASISPKCLGDHVQTMDTFPFLLHQLACAYNYKFSCGSLIVKIPKKDIDNKYETNETREPIYYVKDGQVYLRPEYIIGYVPCKIEEYGKLGIINEFIPNNNKITYDDTTQFVYDEKIEPLINQKKR